MSSQIFAYIAGALMFLFLAAEPSHAQKEFTNAEIDSIYGEYPEFVRNAVKKVGLVWHGTSDFMSFQDLAAFCAPILWYSPDEPLLDGAKGRDIRLPEVLPFEKGVKAPVGYYRVRKVMARASVGLSEEG